MTSWSKLKPIIATIAIGVLIGVLTFIFLKNLKAHSLLAFDAFLIASLIALLLLKRDLNEKVVLYSFVGVILFSLVTFIVVIEINRPIEPFTALYLGNYSKKPVSPFEFNFGIENHEGKQQAYLYRVLGYRNNQSILLNVSAVVLSHNETIIIPIKLAELPNQTNRIAVELSRFGSNETYRRVYFWLATK